MTQQATIKVQKVFSPSGKGPAALVDETGKKWKFWTGGKFGGIPVERFQTGQPYTVGYKTQQYDGKDEFYITEVIQGVTPPAVIARPAAPPPRARTNPTDSEQIFVTALLKSYIEVGAIQLDRAAVKEAVEKLRMAYADSFGSPAKQETEDAMSDRIPF